MVDKGWMTKIKKSNQDGGKNLRFHFSMELTCSTTQYCLGSTHFIIWKKKEVQSFTSYLKPIIHLFHPFLKYFQLQLIQFTNTFELSKLL
jgi:hypothetical protein